MKRGAQCHADRSHYALDLCLPCYFQHWRKTAKIMGRRPASTLAKSKR